MKKKSVAVCTDAATSTPATSAPATAAVIVQPKKESDAKTSVTVAMVSVAVATEDEPAAADEETVIDDDEPVFSPIPVSEPIDSRLFLPSPPPSTPLTTPLTTVQIVTVPPQPLSVTISTGKKFVQINRVKCRSCAIDTGFCRETVRSTGRTGASASACLPVRKSVESVDRRETDGTAGSERRDRKGMEWKNWRDRKGIEWKNWRDRCHYPSVATLPRPSFPNRSLVRAVGRTASRASPSPRFSFYFTTRLHPHIRSCCVVVVVVVGGAAVLLLLSTDPVVTPPPSMP